MTTATTARVRRADLDLGPQLGSGAQGTLFRVKGVRDMDGSSFPFDVVFKAFRPKTQVSGPALDLLVRFRRQLDDHDRQVIDTMTVWPCAVVDEGVGRARGYLMQQIPKRFFQPIETTVGREEIARELQQLFVPEVLARKNLGEAANRVERLALVRDLAFVLGFLHKRDFVYGDLSYKNTVVCLRPQPGVMLLDCDAVRKVGQAPAVAQLHSPGWKPPEGGPQTKATDRYKLGLAILRCLTPGVNAQNRDAAKAVGVLDSEGMSLLRRALGDDPEQRTTGKEWVLYLNRTIAAAGGVRMRTGSAPPPGPAPVRRSPPRPGTYVAPSRPWGPARRLAVPRPAAPSAWSPTGPNQPNAFGNPLWPRWTPAPAPSAGSVQALIAGLAVVFAIVLLGILFAVGASTTSRPAGSSTTRVTGTISIKQVSADAARAAATAATLANAKMAGTVWQVATVSTSGSLTSAPGSASSIGPPVAPSGWVVEFVDPATGADKGTALRVRTFRISGNQATEVAPAALRNVSAVPLDGDWESSLNRALNVVGSSSRFEQDTTDIRWMCDPAGGTAAACRWRFRFVKENGASETFFIAADGSGVTATPSWTK